MSLSKPQNSPFELMHYSRIEASGKKNNQAKPQDFILAKFGPAKTRPAPGHPSSTFKSLEFPVSKDEKKFQISPESPEVEAQIQTILEEARIEGAGQREEIVFAARGEAADIRSEAETDAEEIRRKAKEEGYQEGLRQGDQELTAKLENFEQLLSSLATAADYCLEQYRQQMVELAISCAGKIICREIALDDDIISACVDEALNESGVRGRVRLLLNPIDLNQIESDKSRLLSKHPEILELELGSGEGIERGGCIVETINGRIDASLPGKLEELRRLLTP